MSRVSGARAWGTVREDKAPPISGADGERELVIRIQPERPMQTAVPVLDLGVADVQGISSVAPEALQQLARQQDPQRAAQGDGARAFLGALPPRGVDLDHLSIDQREAIRANPILSEFVRCAREYFEAHQRNQAAQQPAARQPQVHLGEAANRLMRAYNAVQGLPDTDYIEYEHFPEDIQALPLLCSEWILHETRLSLNGTKF